MNFLHIVTSGQPSVRRNSEHDQSMMHTRLLDRVPNLA